MTYVVRAETPTVDQYRRLRVAAGLSPKSAEAAAAGLPGTWFSVVAYREDDPVGMGRVIADGDARHLYAQHGFAETAPDSVGMALQL